MEALSSGITVGSLAATMLCTHSFSCSISCRSRLSISSRPSPLLPSRSACSFSVAYFTCTDRSMNSKRAWITSSCPGTSFLALIRMCSRTPTLPKSCSRHA